MCVRGRILPILISLAGACLIGLLVYGVTAQSANRSLDQALADGQQPPAPEATRTLPRLAGGGSGGSSSGSGSGSDGEAGNSLAAYRGQVVLLNFWASWCPPCQAEAPLLARAQPQLRRHDATVLGVTYLDVSSDSQGFVREHHITYPNLRDTTGEFAHAFGTDQLPESFVVNRSGDIVAICRGEIDRTFVNETVSFAAEGTWRPVPC